MEPNGYTADIQRLTLRSRLGRPGCPRGAEPIDDYGQGVVTPHAAFLALDFAREAAMENLANLAATSPACTATAASRTR